VKAAFEKLQASQTKLGEAIYAQSQAPAGGEEAAGASAGAPEEDIVDAEIIDEDEKK